MPTRASQFLAQTCWKNTLTFQSTDRKQALILIPFCQLLLEVTLNVSEIGAGVSTPFPSPQLGSMLQKLFPESREGAPGQYHRTRSIDFRVEDSVPCLLLSMFPPESVPPGCDDLITDSRLLGEPGL